MSSLPPFLQQLSDRYEYLEKLGDGGMGSIYTMRHRLLDDVRVIKVIHPRHARDKEAQSRFLREARTAIRLKHPGMAQLYDFFVGDDGTQFIVMELIDGVTLEDVLATSGAPPLGLTVEIAVQALGALGYLHRQGYVHRDISPDNLMLNRDHDGRAVVKLIDLGIVKHLGGGGDLTLDGKFMGKARYSAPEELSGGSKKADPRGDVYSFGVLLYELLTGTCPIAGKSFNELIAGHLFLPPMDFGESDPRGRVPEALREVVLRTLAKDPDERLASAEELLDSLRPFEDSSRAYLKDLEGILAAGRKSGGKSEEAEATALVDTGELEQRVDELVDQNRLGEAEQALTEIERAGGDAETVTRLHEKLVAGHVQREAIVEVLLADARDWEKRERFERTLESVHKALEIDPEHEGARELLSATEARLAGKAT